MNHGGLWVCSHRSCLRTQARRSGWFAASCASLWRARRAMQNPPPPPPPRSRGGTPRRQAPGCARSSFSHSPYRRPLSVSRQRPLSAPLSAQLLLSPCGGLPPDSTRQSFMARSHPLWVPRPARSRANSGSGTGRGSLSPLAAAAPRKFRLSHLPNAGQPFSDFTRRIQAIISKCSISDIFGIIHIHFIRPVYIIVVWRD